MSEVDEGSVHAAAGVGGATATPTHGAFPGGTVPAGTPPPPSPPVRPAGVEGGTPAWPTPTQSRGPAVYSSYLEHLPGIYRDSDFLGRFLLIFEDILAPLERTIDNIPDYLDPRIAPADFVPWLGSWLGLVLDDRWPAQRRRELVARASDLYRRRGTRRGLREFLALYTGFEPEIAELTLSEVASARSRAFRFAVRVRVPPGTQVDVAVLERIIELQKPGFAGFSLEVIEG